jgi:spore germination cell wall hydrolase CwlJ-like protein
MNNREVVESLSVEDAKIAVQTAWGEARGEEFEGKVAIVLVGLNRVKQQTWYGKTLKDVFLKPQQFSCWNTHDYNYDGVVGLSWWDADCLEINRAVKQAFYWYRSEHDITKGATHYHTKKVNPSWAKGHKPCVEIGNHLFYNDIR